ncbi:hypothetical protein I4F81_000743 [Pyropia yezoensis]|uniref:Uncharacterized protein n=1 Tax=Pyropia yezoensis TaxID=2788 RepID=A0ACC3BK69_PYRYE|nr:hypothetical protein I4F81_000743 [Neopyropia yezoensis]
MPITAAAIYDARTRTSVAVAASPPLATPATLLSIATFTQHVDNVGASGVATTPAQVAAAWAGPPAITYAVVAARYRVLVFYTSVAGDVDAATDADAALRRLSRVVAIDAPGLAAEGSGGGDATGRVWAAVKDCLEGDELAGVPPGELAVTTSTAARRHSMNTRDSSDNMDGEGEADGPGALEAAALAQHLAALPLGASPPLARKAARAGAASNFAVGNYGVAAALIRRLLADGPPAAAVAALRRRLDECGAAGGGDVGRVPTPGRVDWAGLGKLGGGGGGRCGWCPALYADAGRVGARCTACLRGTVVSRP